MYELSAKNDRLRMILRHDQYQVLAVYRNTFEISGSGRCRKYHVKTALVQTVDEFLRNIGIDGKGDLPFRVGFLVRGD